MTPALIGDEPVLRAFKVVEGVEFPLENSMTALRMIFDAFDANDRCGPDVGLL
jgi:hypothetical protein